MRPPSKPYDIVFMVAILLAPFLLIGLVTPWTDVLIGLALALASYLLAYAPILALISWLGRNKQRL